MNQPDDFQPHLANVFLVFSVEGRGHVKDLKAALRLFQGLYHPTSPSILTVEAANYNSFWSRDRTQRVILMSADGSAIAEAVLVDLYVKLLQHKSTIETQRAKYTVSLDGAVDPNRLMVLTQQALWLSACFRMPMDQRGERYLLN